METTRIEDEFDEEPEEDPDYKRSQSFLKWLMQTLKRIGILGDRAPVIGYGGDPDAPERQGMMPPAGDLAGIERIQMERKRRGM